MWYNVYLLLRDVYMNLLYISGRIKNKKRVESYIHALSKELGIHRLRTKFITVTFKNELDSDAQGYCLGDREEVEIDIARTSCGDPLSMESMMKTLAHEMVHAKQWLRGEINDQGDTWKGMETSGEEPWEVEAYDLEDTLYEKCW